MLCVTTERLPLRRPRGGRWIGGVCRGLSAHLGMPVGVIRLVMVLLVPVGFTGPLLYVWFWVTVPAGDPVQAAMEQRPAALSRLAPRLRDPARKLPLTDIGVGLVLVIGASVLIAARNGADITSTWVLPALIMLAGTALAWSQLDAIQRDRVRSHTRGRTPVSVLRMVGGVGDAVPDAGNEALLQATREVLVIAVTYVRAPYSLYLEVVQDQVEVFV